MTPVKEESMGWFDGFEQGRFPVGGGIEIFARFGGDRGKPPLLLLHGFPQTHAMWHRVARQLATHYRLVIPDLRGYGDSSKPPGLPDHANYSKREMARDLVDADGRAWAARSFSCAATTAAAAWPRAWPSTMRKR